MDHKKISGVYAAVLTPRNADDSIDILALRTLLEFLLAQGISKFALNGATGEFCLTTPRHLSDILCTVIDASSGKAELLCGIGGAGTAQSIALASIAHKEGGSCINGLLLPMPYFFPYHQEDLEAFSREVAAATPVPVLLYNLPQFTSGLDKDTVRTLITEVPNIIGIKDSSGSLEILRDLTAHHIAACRIVGNDSALAPAMLEGVCDGVVSGVACAMPEIILSLYAQAGQTGSTEFQQASALLDAFIEQLNPFPTPWGLKWVLEARSILTATFAQPITPHRRAQAASLAEWFAEWHADALQTASLTK